MEQPPSTAHPPHLATQLAAELLSRHSLPVLPQWITTFLAGVKTPAPPLPVLTSTAHFRLLNSDIRQCLVSSPPASHAALEMTLLTPQMADPNIKIQTLTANVPVQILTVHDVGTSKWAQIEAIERVERGEEIRGREVIRNVPIMDEVSSGTSTTTTTTTGASTNANINTNTNLPGPSTAPNPMPTIKKSPGPHKLTLQDAAGTLVSAFEQSKLPKLFITTTPDEGGVSIGCKLVLRKGCTVRRGMVMLRPEDVAWLGGKVDEWDQAWRRGRKERLMREVVADQDREGQEEGQGQGQENGHGAEMEVED